MAGADHDVCGIDLRCKLCDLVRRVAASFVVRPCDGNVRESLGDGCSLSREVTVPSAFELVNVRVDAVVLERHAVNHVDVRVERRCECCRGR
jgi:hypothetical protein